MNIIRDVTLKAQKYLQEEDIFIFTGPRQSGKTTILRQLKLLLEKENHFCYFLNLEDPDYLSLLNKSPKNLFNIFSLDLNKRNFVFIDEIQYLNNPSNFLKFIFDEYKEKIKLIVSGSSAFYLDKKFKDSLAGRKKIFNVKTLSFREFLRFKKEEGLASKDFKHLSFAEKEKVVLYYREYLLFGGYPRVVLAALEEKQDILSEIAYSYIKKDIYEAHLKQDEVFYKLFKILANQIGDLVNSSELASTLGVSKTAVDNYLYIMQKSFYICLVKPFFKNIRKELIKMPKVYFLDLGLRNFFVGDFGVFGLRKDKGALLENAFFRQLIERYQLEDIKFWRTIQKNEVDFVVGEKLAFEVKAQPKNFRKKDYSLFFEKYSNFPLSIISFETTEKNVDGYKVKEVWEEF